MRPITLRRQNFDQTCAVTHSPAWPPEPDLNAMKCDCSKAADATLHTAAAEGCDVNSRQVCPRRAHQSLPI
jgi:hypothetical protein